MEWLCMTGGCMAPSSGINRLLHDRRLQLPRCSDGIEKRGLGRIIATSINCMLGAQLLALVLQAMVRSDPTVSMDFYLREPVDAKGTDETRWCRLS
mmetsp:Transcript_110715/g.352657  ORF Transcript_110715/g.352657 Transcript_110715/m.352657 type:complete len:96 (-) Transcript_110715:422-709(-)